MSTFFSRLKNWIGLENLSAKDLNAEFNNAMQKLGGDTISGANSTNGSAPTVAAMQMVENPGLVGSENLAVTIQDDVEQLRYMIEQVVGGPQWYSPVPTTLTILNNGVSSLLAQQPNRIISGAIDANNQPQFLVADGTTNAVKLKATVTHFVAYVNGAQETAILDIPLTGLTLAPAANNTATVSDANLAGSQATKTQGERVSILQIDTIGSAISAKTGTYCAFLHGAEVFLGEVVIGNVSAAVTFSFASPTIVTYTAHGLTTNDQLKFTGGSLPASVTAGTIYYVTVIDANTFNISLTIGGSFINTAATGSGTAFVLKSNFIRNAYRGFYFDSSLSWIARTAVTSGDTITLLNLTWVFYTFSAGTSGIDVTYNQPHVSYTQPSTPAAGDYWLDLSVNQWKKYTGSVFAPGNACLIGMCVQDTSKTLAARSFDFADFFSELNNFELQYVDSNNVRTSKQSCQINVYGHAFDSQYDHVNFSMTTDLDTGVTDAASTTYYMYVTDLGARKISNVAPLQRKFDLLGQYHPAKPWRAVGEITNDGSANFIASSLSIQEYHQRVLPDSGVVKGSSLVPGIVDNSTIKIINNILQVALKGITNAQIADLTLTGAKLTNPFLWSGGSQMTGNTNNVLFNITRYLFTSQADTGSQMGILRGTFDSGGVVLLGEGFTVNHTGTGEYTVNFSTGFGDTPVVVAVANANTAFWVSVGSVGAGSVNIKVFNTSNAATDNAVNFYAVGKL